jgi:hypothetical protein
VSNSPATQLYHLACYAADEMTTEVLAEIISHHPEASAVFYKVGICYHYPKHIMAPQEYYNHEHIAETWKEVHGVAPLQNIISENSPEWQLNTIYAIPQEIQQFLNRRYPSASFRHFSTLSLKNLAASNSPGLLQVDIFVDEFELTVVNQNKLILSERYEYASPNDVIYQLLKVCSIYSISQYEAQLNISGLVDKDSALFKELYQYFIKIDLRNASWNHPDYPAHFFTVLNDIARCAS